MVKTEAKIISEWRKKESQMSAAKLNLQNANEAFGIATGL
jgi:hypothetical protein